VSFHEYLVKNRLWGDDDAVKEERESAVIKIYQEITKRVKKRLPDTWSPYFERYSSGFGFKNNKHAVELYIRLAEEEIFEDRIDDWVVVKQSPSRMIGWSTENATIAFDWPNVPYDKIADTIVKFLEEPLDEKKNMTITARTRRVATALTASFHEYLVKNRLDPQAYSDVILQKDELSEETKKTYDEAFDDILTELTKRIKQRFSEAVINKENEWKFKVQKSAQDVKQQAAVALLLNVRPGHKTLKDVVYLEKVTPGAFIHWPTVVFDWPHVPYDKIVDVIADIFQSYTKTASFHEHLVKNRLNPGRLDDTDADTVEEYHGAIQEIKKELISRLQQANLVVGKVYAPHNDNFISVSVSERGVSHEHGYKHGYDHVFVLVELNRSTNGKDVVRINPGVDLDFGNDFSFDFDWPKFPYDKLVNNVKAMFVEMRRLESKLKTASFHEYLVKNRILGDEDEVNELMQKEDEKIVDELVKTMKKRHPDVDAKKENQGMFLMAAFKLKKVTVFVFPWLVGNPEVIQLEFDSTPRAMGGAYWSNDRAMVPFDWPKVPYNEIIDKAYKALVSNKFEER